MTFGFTERSRLPYDRNIRSRETDVTELMAVMTVINTSNIMMYAKRRLRFVQCWLLIGQEHFLLNKQGCLKGYMVCDKGDVYVIDSDARVLALPFHPFIYGSKGGVCAVNQSPIVQSHPLRNKTLTLCDVFPFVRAQKCPSIYPRKEHDMAKSIRGPVSKPEVGSAATSLPFPDTIGPCVTD
ncbi:hypothetical protein J6590_057077 [Homalodisca vitripennis]|nr:hypothetical protein J6590_057077 [Homalodisca vitripennis]